MSRTVHSGIQFANSLRSFRNMNHRRTELSALEEITDAGITPSNRLKSFWSRIPDVNEDFPISANKEYHSKKFWQQWRESGVEPHYTSRMEKQ